MDRRRIESTALFLAIAGTALFMPPLVLLMQHDTRVFGLPVGLVYLFIVWALLVAGAYWLGRRLPREGTMGSGSETED